MSHTHKIEPIKGRDPHKGDKRERNRRERRAVARKLQCLGGCDHSAAEHRAFDAGVLAGRLGQPESSNPYPRNPLRETWLIGRSVTYEVSQPTK